MEHKAFVFHFEEFDRDLRPILELSLRTNDSRALIQFVREHQPSIRDPFEGNPIDDDWLTQVETPDAHQVGDYALTRYYDPGSDIGLGYEWVNLNNELRTLSLGSPIGPIENVFDPGKMGSYFQSREDLRLNYEDVRGCSEQSAGKLLAMYELALQTDTGLYVTF